MKLVIFFATIIVSANSFAQQEPRAMTRENTRLMAPPRSAPPVAMVPPIEPQPKGSDISELLRAQTNAIKSLSSKLDSLEERIRKIESGTK